MYVSLYLYVYNNKEKGAWIWEEGGIRKIAERREGEMIQLYFNQK